MGITATEVLRNINIGQLCGVGFKQSSEKSPVTMQKRVMEAATGVFSQQNSEATKVKNLFRAVEVIQSGKMTFVEKVRDVWARIKMVFTKGESFEKVRTNALREALAAFPSPVDFSDTELSALRAKHKELDLEISKWSKHLDQINRSYQPTSREEDREVITTDSSGTQMHAGYEIVQIEVPAEVTPAQHREFVREARVLLGLGEEIPEEQVKTLLNGKCDEIRTALRGSSSQIQKRSAFLRDEAFKKCLEAAKEYVKNAETTPENANLERLRKAALLTAYYSVK
jgi:hypothetical protein